MPTMEELELTVLDLANRLAEQERRNRSQQAILDAMLVNGMEELLTGHGLQYFGNGLLRLDSSGVQVQTNGGQTEGMWFLDQFVSGNPEDLSTPYYGSVRGLADSVQGEVRVSAVGNNGNANMEVHSDSSLRREAKLYINPALSPSVSIGVVENLITGAVYGYLNEAPFLVGPTGADYSNLQDGELWYRTDTDKFRARINGVTENLATESYVAATAYTNVEDEGLPLTHRSTINFTGAGVTASDSGGKTVVNIPGGGGGGGGNSVTATVDFGASFTDKASVVVTGQAWVTANSEITAQMLCPSGVDPDEFYLLDFQIVISALVAGDGFTVTVYSESEAKGTYDIMCIGV